jgi:HTH-type transcriptional repressor of NAD biosynthesis genes
MFKHGLVVGKFYPPHLGHSFLIDQAEEKSQKTTVIVAARTTESISPWLRARWIKTMHPRVEVKVILIPEELSDDDSVGWGDYTKRVLAEEKVDAVFTSEDYGDPYSKQLGAVHVLVDKKRATIPISGTLVRRDPIKYAQYLNPVVKAYFVMRIAIVGTDSTGKTTLTRQLAEHFKTCWVPEYGRIYTEGKYTSNRIWKSREFELIADGQLMMEDHLAEDCNGLLFCDTDVMITALWHERYLMSKNSYVESLAKNKTYDLYILTDPNTPFEDDGTRDIGQENLRYRMHVRITEKLIEGNCNTLSVYGNQEQRLTQAIRAVNSLREIRKLA